VIQLYLGHFAASPACYEAAAIPVRRAVATDATRRDKRFALLLAKLQFLPIAPALCNLKQLPVLANRQTKSTIDDNRGI
jgi:hypothetical protein